MKISEQQFRELLDRYISGTATPSERELLDRFFESYSEARGDTDRLRSDASLREELLQRILSRVGHTRRRTGRFISLWIPLAAAISVFVLVYISVDRFNGSPVRPHTDPSSNAPLVKVETKAGRLVKILPDGTAVHLNSNTAISYPRKFGSVRLVNLRGEAFFEVVADGKPFVVTSGNVQTKVLGTSFNVRTHEGGDVAVTLVEGKVNVVAGRTDSVRLRPGWRAVVSASTNSVTSREVNVLRFTGWKDDILFFEQTALEEAVVDLERWYGVKIEIVSPSVRRCIITAKYHNEPLGNVLSSLQFLLGLDIKRVHDDYYEISGKGCR